MLEQLHFRLYGALASWGDIAVGEMRPSANRPTRSAVLGLIAAALGIDRSDEPSLAALDHLGVAMRVDDTGLPLHDYHTAQAAKTERQVVYRSRRDEITWNSNKELGTILSSRTYRQDSLCHIALLRTPTAPAHCPTLKACRDALEHPHFPLYLGRRSCPPALPLAARLLTADTCAVALRASPPAACALPGNGTLPTTDDTEWWFWDEHWQTSGGAPDTPQRTERRHDQKTNHRAWLFAQRDEYSATIPIVNSTITHTSTEALP